MKSMVLSIPKLIITGTDHDQQHNLTIKNYESMDGILKVKTEHSNDFDTDRAVIDIPKILLCIKDGD